MFPVSDDFRTTVRSSHRATVRVEVWRDGQKLARIFPTGGEVVIDARRSVRSTVSLELVATRGTEVVTEIPTTYADLALAFPTYSAAAAAGTYEDLEASKGSTTAVTRDPLVPAPGSSSDLLSTYGNELRVWRGARVTKIVRTVRTYAQAAAAFPTYAAAAAAGTYDDLATASRARQTVTEEVPLGVFVISEVGVDDSGAEVKISVEGDDRSLLVTQNRWTAPFQIAAGTNVVTAIRSILESRYDRVTLIATDTTATVGAAVLGQETGNDPWADARAIATAAGMDLYFNGEGNAVLEPIPAADDLTAVVSFAEGEVSTLLSAARKMNRRTTYSGVVVTGEGTSTSTPVRAEVWDDDPASPTYRFGPFGQVPFFYSSSLVTSAAQAQAVAEGLLRKVTGLAESLEWQALVDPSIGPGDVVAVSAPAARVSKVLILDSVTVPLTVDAAMSAVGRTAQEVTES